MATTTETVSNCANALAYYVNYNAKDANGDYPCRDSKNPCYLPVDIQKVIYQYTDLVKRKIIPAYDRVAAPGSVPVIEDYVSRVTGIEKPKVAAILWELYNQTQSGKIPCTTIINPMTLDSSVNYYLIGALVLAGFGTYFYYEYHQSKTNKGKKK